MHHPSRRRFLLHAGGAAAAWAAAGLARGLPPAAAGGPFGIQLWTVDEAMRRDPAGTLNALAKIGYREVEPVNFAGLDPGRLRRLLDDAGLRCPSVHLQFDLDHLDRAFDEAHLLGARYVVAGSLVGPLKQAMASRIAGAAGMGRDEARRTAALANRIGAAARRAGLQFALHNHAREFVDLGNGETGYDVVWRETDPAVVQFEIDCGWMKFSGRDPVDYLRNHPGRVPLIHVKDYQPRRDRDGAPTAEAMRGAELGTGVVDYRPILAAARLAGVRHCFAEQEGPFSRMSQLEAAQVAYRHLQAIN